MKNLIKPVFGLAVLILSLGACTAGDKGSEKVPDSASIDTSRTSGGTGGSSASVDSSSIDNAATPSNVSRDTSQKNRSANGAADYKPNNSDSKSNKAGSNANKADSTSSKAESKPKK
jgi:hypothetical protein